MKLPMKWTHRDLGLRVFYRADEGPYFVADGIGRVGFDDFAPDPRLPWLAVIDGDQDEPTYHATQRHAKLSILATMVWKNKAYQERLHAELGDEGCPF